MQIIIIIMAKFYYDVLQIDRFHNSRPDAGNIIKRYDPIDIVITY